MVSTARILTLQVLVFFAFFGKGICDSLCPNGIVNITGSTAGTLVYPSSGNYGINETKCWRIEVPKPYVGIGLYVHSYDIEECKSCECDKLNFGSSYGNSLPLSNTRCVRRTSRFQEVMYEFTRDAFPDENADGRNIWFRFVSDDTNHYKGFNFSYIVKSDSPGSSFRSILNASENETFEIGTPKVGIKNYYPAGFEWQWFLIVPEGRQVQLTFDTFELEQSTDCENDYLEVRGAITVNVSFSTERLRGRFGPILSKPVCGTNKPTTIQSTGNKMWVHFKSDNNTSTTYKGFKASFKAGKGKTRLYIRHPMALLFLSVLLTVMSKDSLL